ncbi:MAG: heavy metal-associated domain-containing protein [Bacteroidota bacterium]|nr:heavy metal-associated domain-containing protein [Bacteroidota bacterium]
MKTKMFISLLLVALMSVSSLFAQKKGDATSVKVKIKTSAVCGMCKATISKALSKVDGLQEKTLDLKTNFITVVYNPTKTSPAKIRKAITMAGYDADDIPADSKAYANLHSCCKKL